ncbi:MAG: type II toxin-antitoxin system VapB family antitoxin [Verrucomicrobia bacterium]|nr:type II toxin-antitoxin system VapB family antitoxin [Verrucomicrobiota bacterium]
MKMTLQIDDGLLARVMMATGTDSKTRAIDLALREMDRRTTLARLTAEGLGLGPDELKDALDPVYDLAEMRRRERSVNDRRKSRSH